MGVSELKNNMYVKIFIIQNLILAVETKPIFAFKQHKMFLTLPTSFELITT